ncbi:hypothetical protein CRUP_020734 [Coryphaenoides rupestris]|nr:hypothetical protein CRUP_020734 [Coryphaenoides rupestris]
MSSVSRATRLAESLDETSQAQDHSLDLVLRKNYLHWSHQVRFSDYKVVNVLAVCSMPFSIRLIDFTKKNRPIASYEPELHPAVTYRIKQIKATVQVFSTGSITVTGPNVQNVATAVEQVYPLLFECRKPLRK